MLNSLRETVWANMPDAEYAETVESVAKAGSIRNTAGLHRVLIEKAVTAVVKGDYQGHPFRGNQWSNSEGQSRGGAGGMARTTNLPKNPKSIMSWPTGSKNPRLDGPTVKTRPMKWGPANKVSDYEVDSDTQSVQIDGKDESGISYRITRHFARDFHRGEFEGRDGEWTVMVGGHSGDPLVADALKTVQSDWFRFQRPKSEAEAKRMCKQLADRVAGEINDRKQVKAIRANAESFRGFHRNNTAMEALFSIAHAKNPQEAQKWIDQYSRSAKKLRSPETIQQRGAESAGRSADQYDEAVREMSSAYKSRFGHTYAPAETTG